MPKREPITVTLRGGPHDGDIKTVEGIAIDVWTYDASRGHGVIAGRYKFDFANAEMHDDLLVPTEMVWNAEA